MKLVLYGGGEASENYLLDKEAIQLTGKSYPKMTYIPSASFDGEIDFKDFIEQYSSFDLTQFIYFPIDLPFDKVLMMEAFKSDIIHLAGGNTFYFLYCLRKQGLLKELKSFVKRGGVLTGLSAGGIIMTPSISTAAFPSFDRDDNDVNLKNLKSLGLVSFDFFPHYRNSVRYEKALLSYSKKNSHPLIACPDGSGVVVDDKALKFVGKVSLFFQGKRIKF